MKNHLAYTIATVAILFAGQDAASQVVLEDGDFDLDNDWTLHHIYSPVDGDDDAVASVDRGFDDGNPGSFAAMNHRLGPVPTDFTGNTSSWAILVYDKAGYDPGDPNLGPLTSVTVAWDVRRSPSAPRRNGRIIAAFVRQDGYVWGAYVPRRSYSEADMDSWLSDDSGVLLQSDFTKTSAHPAEQPAEPDFSTSGSPIFFGFASGNSCPPTSDCRVTIDHPSDFDNFRVEAGDALVPGSLTIGAVSTAYSEAIGEIDMQVTRQGGSSGAVSVEVQSFGETATEGADYGAFSGIVQFADRESGSKPISIRVLDDEEVEETETLLMQLSNPTGGATLGTPDSLQISLLDDDAEPVSDIRLDQSNFVITSTLTRGMVTSEFPQRFAVQAVLRNDGPDPATDIRVEIYMPKIALAAFDVPASASNCRFTTHPDPDPTDDFVPNDVFLFVLCDIAGSLAAGASQAVPADPIIVGYADTVRITNIDPPDYHAYILGFTGQDSNENNNNVIEAPQWQQDANRPLKGGGSMAIPFMLLITVVAALRRRVR